MSTPYKTLQKRCKSLGLKPCNGPRDALERLLERHDEQDRFVESPSPQRNLDDELRWAARYGFVKEVRHLIELGANVRIYDDEPLRWAAEYGNADVVTLLVRHGADLMVRDGEVRKVAERYHHWAIVDYFDSMVPNAAVVDSSPPQTLAETTPPMKNVATPHETSFQGIPSARSALEAVARWLLSLVDD